MTWGQESRLVDEHTASGPYHNKTALVVDDEPFARIFATQILQDEGFAILEAVDAREALHVLAENPDISLLFTDISMPGELDGIDLAIAEEVRRDLAVILTSGRRDPSQESALRRSRFLPKPYTAHALVSMVRELADGPANNGHACAAGIRDQDEPLNEQSRSH